jgi:carbon-monoxide dehydrogenase large subunit
MTYSAKKAKAKTPVTNPLGVKGCGEAGNGGSMPAVINAILHALETRGITELDASAKPHRVW